MKYYTTGQCAERHNTLLCCSKFTYSCRVSEQQEGKRERQVMLPLVLLIKFVLLLIIFQIRFSFNLLVANWRLLPEFWQSKFFSLAMATKMVSAWSAEPEYYQKSTCMLKTEFKYKFAKLTHTSADKSFSIRHSCILPKEAFWNLSPSSCLLSIINLCIGNMKGRNKVLAVHDLLKTVMVYNLTNGKLYKGN